MEEAKESETLRGLEDRRKALLRDASRLHRDVDRFLRVASGPGGIESSGAEALRLLGFTPSIVKVIELLSLESGNPPSVVLPSALGLYKIGLDAERDGNRLAIVDPAGEVVQDVTDLSNPATRGAEIPKLQPATNRP